MQEALDCLQHKSLPWYHPTAVSDIRLTRVSDDDDDGDDGVDEIVAGMTPTKMAMKQQRHARSLSSSQRR